jgi:uncharacterized membrane protein YgdD (TMEM256/DUF423 family)
MTSKNYTIIAIFFIFLSIILGAVAAHSLKSVVSSELILTFEKGVKYMMYSGLGLLTISLNSHRFNVNLKWALNCISIGTLLFSGNIFLYIFHEYIPSLKHFVHVVPVGGLLMIVGWGIILWHTARKKLQ